MKPAPEHSALLADVLAELRSLSREIDQLRAEVSTLRQEVRQPSERSDALERAYASLEMLRGYTVKEAAEIMKLKPRSVREIPEWDLPRCYVGRGRGALRFIGADLFCYITGLPMIDHAAHVERLKDRLARTAPAPVKMPGGGRRVL